MSTDQPQDTDLNIISKWLTTAQVADMHKMDPASVRYLCIHKRLRAVKLGRDWRINPNSANNYRRRKSSD